MTHRFSKDELVNSLWQLLDLTSDGYGLDIDKGTAQVKETDPDREAKLQTLAEIRTILNVITLVQHWENERLHIWAQHKRMTERNERNN